MYRLKQVPEDFIVEEIPLKRQIDPSGEYSYYRLKKTLFSTQQAIEFISSSFKVPEKSIGYAGLKDKQAITAQFISIKGRKAHDLTTKNLSLQHLGFIDERINLGDLEGNSFTLIVRNLSEKEVKKINSKARFFPNLFGEQRFSKNNVEIGRSMLKQDFKTAISLIKETDTFYSVKISSYLDENPTNLVGALSLLPQRILRIYIHSYQSHLWNQAAETFLKKKKVKKDALSKLSKIKIPIIGFSTELDNYNKDLKKILKAIMKKENISPRDFIIRKIPQLTSEGNERLLLAEAKGLKISKLSSDELNKGKKKLVLAFTLGKGSYATIFIGYLLK